GLGALACVCIIALSTWLYANPDTLAQVQQLLGFGAEPRAAQFLPASTLVFVSVNPSFPQLASFSKLKTVFEKNPAYAKKLNDLAQANTPGNGVQFERDVLPWLGSEAAIALLDYQPNTSSHYAGKTQRVVFMAVTRDQTKSDEAIARVRGTAAEQGWTFDEETYKGVRIATSTPPAGAYGPRTQGGAFSTFQGWVLYGTDAETIKL